VHEIDHHLTYKRPPGTSDQGWIIWKTLSDNEVADLSKTIYNIAVTLDRKRQMASILQSIGTPELRALCDTPRTHGNIEEHLRHFAHTKVLAANLSTGLAERQTEIEFDSKGFVGLVKQSFTNTEGFDWETGALDFSKAEIFNFDRLDSTDHLVLVTQGYKEEFDKLNQCKPHLLDLWLNLWRRPLERRTNVTHFIGARGGFVPAQREMERERSPLVSIPPLRGGDFQGIGVYRSDVFWGRARKASLRAQHRLDEPTKLSLGMVASLQSPLRFTWQGHCSSHPHATRCRRC